MKYSCQEKYQKICLCYSFSVVHYGTYLAYFWMTRTDHFGAEVDGLHFYKNLYWLQQILTLKRAKVQLKSYIKFEMLVFFRYILSLNWTIKIILIKVYFYKLRVLDTLLNKRFDHSAMGLKKPIQESLRVRTILERKHFDFIIFCW